jgi:hypothetical protein
MRLLTKSEVERFLALIKSRHLVMFDHDKDYAHSPFPYDKRFFKELRKDQVPRFLRCLTDPWKLPLQYMQMDKLVALQNRVKLEKVEAIRSNPTQREAVVVRIRKDGPDTIADGLHRMSADWLDHLDEVAVRYADLSDKLMTVEPVPGAGKFDSAQDKIEHTVMDAGYRP